MSVRCPDCDALIATQADFDAHADGCECDRCCALCWRAWCADVCQREPVDWRSRLSALEGLLRESRGAVQGLLDYLIEDDEDDDMERAKALLSRLDAALTPDRKDQDGR